MEFKGKSWYLVAFVTLLIITLSSIFVIGNVSGIKGNEVALVDFADDVDDDKSVDDDSDVAPAPPSIGADIPLVYFGPAPSDVQKELIGPHQLLKAGKINEEKTTITMPLYEGKMDSGEIVWYVVTDSSDKFNSDALGINHSPKLAYSDVGNAVRKAYLDKDLTVVFQKGKVDFSVDRKVIPGDAPNYFPPKVFSPGSVGDKYYSPLVKIRNAGGHVYNAPIVAFDVSEDKLNKYCKGNANHKIVHDKVVSICPKKGTVTLSLTTGFSFSRPVLYLSLDANHKLPATLEEVTFAPGLDDIPVGADDSLFSSVERIFVAINGHTGKGNPHRQGLNSAIVDGFSPLNTLGGIPTIATDYSPLWDVNPYVWTAEAIEKGFRSRLTEEFDILGKVDQGWITGPEGGDFGSIGFIVNCPIVFRFL